MAGEYELFDCSCRVSKLTHLRIQFGAAGFLPYMGTSLSTIYLARQVNQAQSAGGESGKLPASLTVLSKCPLQPTAQSTSTQPSHSSTMSSSCEYGNGLHGSWYSANTYVDPPSQISYGAVILSFLGALHWGFEFASYNGRKGMPRYLMGVFPVLIGWPTLLLPAMLALPAQWAAFTAVWYTDSRATARGWTPKWFSTVSHARLSLCSRLYANGL